ncbi:MAG: hypothetical protein ABN482_06990 [Corticimicrobacter sp.]|uniref:hypothetical protein n=1 Tax=Corticimicrobacter sp. TaxID=2678536 RepID=UPI0032DBA5DE
MHDPEGWLDRMEGRSLPVWLEAHGVDVLRSRNVQELHALRAGHEDACVALWGLAGASLFMVAELRLGRAGTGIVLLMAPDSAQDRAHALLAGIDYCLPGRPDPSELLSVLQALRRARSWQPGLPPLPRAAPAPAERALPVVAPLGKAWRLGDSGWQLHSPEGPALRLTVMERILLQGFFQTDTGYLSLEELYRLLSSEGVADTPLSGEAVWLEQRFVSRMHVLVFRLRRKAAKSALQLPLHCVRGKGYMFAASFEPYRTVVPIP